MSLDDIEQIKADWVAAVKRAVKAGVDFMIHIAHGYLLASFLTPVSNNRTDAYGGSFENRIRLSLDIAQLTRETVPEGMPVFMRLPETDWLEESMPNGPSWKLEDAVAFAQTLADTGSVDLVDVCSGGNHSSQQIKYKFGFHAYLAASIKRAVGDRLLISAAGGIETATLANELLTKEQLGFVLVGRGFLKNPGLVWQWAEELNVEIGMANQFRRPFFQRGGSQFSPKI